MCMYEIKGVEFVIYLCTYSIMLEKVKVLNLRRGDREKEKGYRGFGDIHL